MLRPLTMTKGRKSRRNELQTQNPPAKLGTTPPGGFLNLQGSLVTWNSGPIPPPEILSRYNTVVPNGADRLLVLAEKQTNHRIELENKVLDSDIRRSDRGLIFGLVIALAGFGFAFGLACLGHPKVGALFGAAPLATLVTVFITSNNSKREEREKMREMQIRVNRR